MRKSPSEPGRDPAIDIREITVVVLSYFAIAQETACGNRHPWSGDCQGVSVKGDGPVLDAHGTMDHPDQPYGMPGISAEAPGERHARGTKGLATLPAMRAYEAHSDQGFSSLGASLQNVCRR